jgi:hypothetical protein
VEGSCSTGQSPQRAVVPVEEEEVTKQIALSSTTYTDSYKQQQMGRKKNKEETILY